MILGGIAGGTGRVRVHDPDQKSPPRIQRANERKESASTANRTCLVVSGGVLAECRRDGGSNQPQNSVPSTNLGYDRGIEKGELDGSNDPKFIQ